MKQTNNSSYLTYSFIISILIVCIAGIAIVPSFSDPGLAIAADHTLQYTIDRSQLPGMNYYDLTLNIKVGDVSFAEVRNGSGSVIPSTYDAGSGILTVTTDETTLNVTLNDFSGSTDGIGEITIAQLKDNKLWAWSHGFDDNAGFLKAIYEFEQYGVPATLYLNDYDSSAGNIILDPDGKSNPPNPYTSCDDNNNSLSPLTYECYLLLGSKIRQLLDDGWAIGNHTENHLCWNNQAERPSDEVLWQDIVDVQTKLYSKIVAESNRTDYLINSFAAPCFNDYNDLIQEKIAADQTDIIMSEGGFIDYSSPDGLIGSSNRLPLTLGYDFTKAVIRDNRVEGTMNDDSDDANSLAFTKSIFDWLHENSSENNQNAYWYNTISHSRNEDVFAEAIPYLINTYGSGSQYDEVWLATAEEVFAYTYVKEKATISLSCSSTIGDCNSNPVVIPDAVPAPNQIIGRAFNDANQNGIDDNEPGIENVQMYLWNDDGCNGATSSYVGETFTTGSGSYSFDGLNPSACYILSYNTNSASGQTVTTINAGSDDTVDSDFYENGYTDSVALPAVQVNIGLYTEAEPTPTPTIEGQNTPVPTQTPAPLPTATPLPTGLGTSQVINSGSLSPEFLDWSYNANVDILTNGFAVDYTANFGGFRIVKNFPLFENALALTFDVYQASPFTQVNLVWVTENYDSISDVQLDINLCPGSYVISDNIPEIVAGFVLQESSGNKLISGFHSYEIRNVQFIVNEELSTNPTIPTSMPNCEPARLFLPLNVR